MHRWWRAALTATVTATAAGLAGGGLWTSAGAAAGAVSAGSAVKTHSISGYVVGVSNSATVVGKIRIPTLACATGDTGAVSAVAAVGGTEPGFSVSGALVASCGGVSGVVPEYTVSASVDGNTVDATGTVDASDVLRVDIVAGPAGYQVTVQDLKTGAEATNSGAGVLTSDVEVATGGAGTFPPFGRVAYSAVTVNADPLGQLSPTRNVEVDAKGHLEITAGKISASGSFRTVYKTDV